MMHAQSLLSAAVGGVQLTAGTVPHKGQLGGTASDNRGWLESGCGQYHPMLLQACS